MTSILASLKDDDRVGMAHLWIALTEPPDPELTAISRTFSDEHNLSMAGINIALKNGVQVVGSVGLPSYLKRAPMATSICAYVAAQDSPLILDRPREQMPVSCLGARAVKFYAGVPVHLNGQVVGAFFCGDKKPRRDGHRLISALEVQAERVEGLIKARHRDLLSLTT